MPTFALRPVTPKFPVAGLIARGAQVSVLCSKLAGRKELKLVDGDGWAAVFSEQAEDHLPWLSDRPMYLYTIASGLLCQSGFAPDVPAPLLPALTRKLTSKGAVALTEGPILWDFSAAIPVEQCNLRDLR